jgi:protocatechuate 3,4-dioxygenase beta subunit
MRPITPRAWMMLVVAGMSTAGPAAQVPPPPPPSIRDPGAFPQRDPTQPGIRRVPIGSAVISGTVSVADTGQPVRGARVTLNGSFRPPDSTAAGTGMTPGTPTVVSGRGSVPGQVITNVGMGGMSVSRTVVTDAQGQFSFPRLPAGQFSLNASRNQFLGVTYGQRRPNGPGTTIQLSDGQQMKVSLRMSRGAVISGMVTGPDGDPHPFAQVRAMRYVMTNGIKRLQQSGGTSSDDRGIYRLSGLQPGDYIISATPNTSDLMSERMMNDAQAVEQAILSGAVQPPTAPGMPPTVVVQVSPPIPVNEGPPGYLPTYYPGTLVVSQATPIQVAGNDERIGLDIQVLPVAASSITGTVVTPLAQGVAVQVSLLPEDPTNATTSMSTRIQVQQEGRFTFRNVSPGKYTVLAQTVAASPTMTIVNGVPSPPTGAPPRLDDTQRLWGRSEVSVDGPTAVSVSIGLQPGRSISGTVLFEMERPPDLVRNRFTVMLAPAPSAQMMSVGPAPQAQIGPDGRFTLVGVVPGQYTIRATGGTMTSAMAGGQDTLDFPLEFTGERDVTDAVLTVTDRISELSGVLTDGAAKPAVDFTIIVAPTDPRFWRPGSRRVMLTRPDTTGRYLFRSLPPGDYMLAAVTDIEQGGQFDPEFLKTLAGNSVRINVTEGGKVAQDIRVAR